MDVAYINEAVYSYVFTFPRVIKTESLSFANCFLPRTVRHKPIPQIMVYGCPRRLQSMFRWAALAKRNTFVSNLCFCTTQQSNIIQLTFPICPLTEPSTTFAQHDLDGLCQKQNFGSLQITSQ
jgi:hypothetical protein